MEARIKFTMIDRSEYTFTCEGDDQHAVKEAGELKLNEALAARLATANRNDEVLTGGWNKIETWRTTKEDGTAGVDKADGVGEGIAVRSTKQKLRFELMPVLALTEVARVFTFGSYEYGDRNWEAGFSWSRCVGSIWRHFLKWCAGEDLDDDSNCHHLAHVVANCLFIIEYTITKKGTDDRQRYPAEIVKTMFASFEIDETTNN